MPPKSTEAKRDQPPEFISDKGTGKTYQVGEFLGSGGYAECYKIRDVGSNELFACKVMSNSLLVEQKDLEKVGLEMVLQHGIRHENVVRLYTYFQDDINLYIILELCAHGTLQSLVKIRGVLTELEARYFLKQILMGIRFLHSSNLVHRDIKPANIFIHETMTLKIGDFGLATLLNYYGQRKTTVCGTPNFLPPEILLEEGHSFEADIWCVGVILYNMLLGGAPFQRNDVEQTYDAIKDLSYTIPPGKISVEAKNLIESILVSDPTKRAKLHQILRSDFMTKEAIPITLPDRILKERLQFKFREPAFKAPVYNPSAQRQKRLAEPEPKNLKPTAGATRVNEEDEQEQDATNPIKKKAKATVDAIAVDSPVANMGSTRRSTRNLREALASSSSTYLKVTEEDPSLDLSQ